MIGVRPLKWGLTPIIVALFLFLPGVGQGQQQPRVTGFLVLAPDRGFLGNAETRAAFDEYSKGFPALTNLAFVGEKDTERFIRIGLSQLDLKGASEIVVLPIFLSESHPLYKKAIVILTQGSALSHLPIHVSRTMAGRYLITEILSDRVLALSQNPSREALALVAQGASDPLNAAQLELDLTHAAHAISGRFPFAQVHAVALEGWDPLRDPSGKSDLRLARTLKKIRAQKLNPGLIPFDLTTKMDSMMALSTRLKSPAKEFTAAYDGADMTPHPNIALWLTQESNRWLPVTEKNLGIVFMAHGADLYWNHTMLDSIAPLSERYLIEPALGMADPVLLELAIRKLEERGARSIAVLRVFSLETSFKDVTQCLLGLSPCAAQSMDRHLMAHDFSASHNEQGMRQEPKQELMAYCAGVPLEHRHAAGDDSEKLNDALSSEHHGMNNMPGLGAALGIMAGPRPIRTGSVLYTLGGIEDSPSFAQALCDRALNLSKDPKSETVFLVAHGAGEDTENEHWLKLLGSIATQVKTLAAKKNTVFRDIRVGTWREDWPEKNAAAVKAIRDEIRQASETGTAIVIPARTTLGGPEQQFLSGVTYRYDGQSFAPHANFALWVEQQIRAALDHFNSQH